MRRLTNWMLLLCLFSALLAGVNPSIVHSAPECPAGNSTGTFMEGSQEFAIGLYKQIARAESNLGKNIFFSPYSISTALGMTYAGARGETEKQMAAVLHFGPDQDAVHQSLQNLSRSINAAGKPYQLSAGNALWAQKDYPFTSEYLALVTKYYDSGFNAVDFIRETELSREKINQWVAQKTADKIKGLLQQGDVSELTRLVLTNAIYFKGNWATQFDRNKTRPAPFTVKPGETKEIQMMFQTGQISYAETERLQAIELPYAGDELSMIVLLPKEGIDGLEEQFSRQQVDALLLKFKPASLDVYLPRFKFDARYGLHDPKVLPAMGMVDAFNESLADFSGLTGKKELFISGIFHKAFIDVNESGTEAAAATAVVIGVKSMPLPAAVFRADHPFLFLIRHKSTGSILFMGRVANPE